MLAGVNALMEKQPIFQTVDVSIQTWLCFAAPAKSASSLEAKMMCCRGAYDEARPRKKTHGAIIQIVTPAKTGSERHDVKCAGRTLGQFPEATA